MVSLQINLKNNLKKQRSFPMKNYIVHFIIILALLGQSTISVAKDSTSDKHETSKHEIKQVIKDYQSAIVEKNERNFDLLLQRDLISWLETTPSNRTGTLPSQMGLGTPQSGFYIHVFGSDAKFEEKISNIRIQTDGDVGSVFYDYELFKNDESIKNGSTSWHLVRNFEGWRINSILSSNLEGKSHTKKKALESEKEVEHVFLSGEISYTDRDEATYFSHVLHPYIVYLPIDSSRRKGNFYSQQGNEAYVPATPWMFWHKMEIAGVDLFPNQVITTNGEIASIYHKDREEYDGTGENLDITGDQVTDYVRTPDGWKMIAKTFSVNHVAKQQ